MTTFHSSVLASPIGVPLSAAPSSVAAPLPRINSRITDARVEPEAKVRQAERQAMTFCADFILGVTRLFQHIVSLVQTVAAVIHEHGPELLSALSGSAGTSAALLGLLRSRFGTGPIGTIICGAVTMVLFDELLRQRARQSDSVYVREIAHQMDRFLPTRPAAAAATAAA